MRGAAGGGCGSALRRGWGRQGALLAADDGSGSSNSEECHCDGSDGVMAAMAATAATVATVAVRRGGERRHEGNLADARTQPNNLTPPQNFAQGSAQGQCPGGFNDGGGA